MEPLKERDLSRHLQNGDGKSAAELASEAKKKHEEALAKLQRTDYQLFEALNLLKGLNIAREMH